MILLTNCAGQTCNRILYLARAIALSVDTNRNMLVVCGRDILEFSNVINIPSAGYKIRCLNLPRLKFLDWINSLFEGLCRRMGRPEFMPQCEVDALKCRSRWLPIVLWSWSFKNFEGVVRNREQVVSCLRAKDRYHGRAKSILSAFPKQDLIVGVHIRRGDYKTAFGGKYYYSDEQYADFILRFAAALGKRIVFAAVSNEKINVQKFRDLGCELYDVSGAPCEDVVLLSECDMIVGPPSTFSGWAAYYGDKPLYTISEIDDPIDLTKLRKLYQ